MIDRSHELEGRVGSLRILIVGDVILDKYVCGEVRRISPEAPIPIVEVKGLDHRLGGAANVAANVAALGSRPALVGLIGNDPEGASLLEAIEAQGIEAHSVHVHETRPTTTKTRVIAQSKQIARFDYETREPVGTFTEAHLLSRVDEELIKCDICVISDYGKGVVTPSLAASVISRARQNAKLVLVDPKGCDYEKYRGTTLITPNVAEVEGVLRCPINCESELVKAGETLAGWLGCAVLITRGADGMSLFNEGRHAYFPARAHNVFDVTGAGDTVIGVMGVALAGGLSFRESTILANKAAGIVVEKAGTSTVSLTELLADSTPTDGWPRYADGNQAIVL